jgi:hypothetical protein
MEECRYRSIFVTSALVRSEWSASRLVSEPTGTHGIKDWVEPVTSLEAAEQSPALSGIELRSSTPLSVVVPTELSGLRIVGIMEGNKF